MVESYHVTFIESKDEYDVPLRPGIIQGLDDEPDDIPSEVAASPNPPLEPDLHHAPNPNPGFSSTQATPLPNPTTIPPTPSTSKSSHIRRSSRTSRLSTRSAEAFGVNQLSAVQCTTAQSIASKAHLDKQRHTHHHSRSASHDGTVENNPPAPPVLDDLVKIAYKAADELSDAQAASILEQPHGDGFEWGLSADIDVTNSPDEPCSLAEALTSPDAPKWLAACHEELSSIQDLKVFQLVPRNAATRRTIMDGKFVFRLKCD